jgi:NAD(P)-dependent dehydrogenase (short-subunit alcohol dehydrogenase family)
MTSLAEGNILQKFSLAGKTAIVTGAAGLLGAEFSRALAQAGASVILADIDEQTAGALAKELVDVGLRAYPVGTDVTQ